MPSSDKEDLVHDQISPKIVGEGFVSL
jgi:hypothetical protein